MSLNLQRWIKISLINLLIVATLGVILRYKIAFSLPFIDQKHLLHGHSHFAFAGWISQAIMTLLVAYLSKQNPTARLRKYQWLLYGNLFTAYAMLIAFPVEGYGLFSIIFSTCSIFVSYIFMVIYWKDLNKLKENNPAHSWFKTAILLNSFSSLGAFALAIMMAAKIVHQNWYLAAEYFYLHFQYNGWFFFACMGLIVSKLSVIVSPEKLKRIFLLFAGAIAPAYFLSTLWMHIPVWVYILIVVAAFAQVFGWMYTIYLIKSNTTKLAFTPISKWLFIFSGIALSIKLLLQLGSTIPSLSTLAFGFRPIVIGYLHLVLLGVTTIFLLGYMFVINTFTISKTTAISAGIFIAGIIINEIFLMTQGVSALTYITIPFINEALLLAALIMFIGLLILITNLKLNTEDDFNHN
ncbi:hypothetical protein ACQ33O_04875 [Ferruginibacter sp. SUN002]|uniref:hypothetical protein n=1 Tax=Ferruginibacter sp. SUN002 TaxID=2937789 RepID=UPI003D36756A